MQRSLEGFTLIELVGFGATGEVWRARPDSGGAEVALKWLTDESFDTDQLSCSRLHDFVHPHVARLLELRRDRSGVVLVQEFISGVSLATLLTEREQLSGAEVVTLLTPVADALGAAHDADLLHGNLTPSAVIVTPDGRPMLTDLGVWQILAVPNPGAARLEYLDPSVARGGPVTKASDVFGVAAIGFHALTGRPPWAAGSGADMWELAAESAGVDLRPLHASTPAPLAHVIARGLSEQPRHRGSAQAFAADVRDAVEPQPLHLAGPYVWPDLPPLAEDLDRTSGPAVPAALATVQESPSNASRTASADIAGEVRRGTSARHAATPSTRRERDERRSALRHPVGGFGYDPPSRLRSAARVVPRRAVVCALVALAVLAVVVLGLGWNASKSVPAAQAGAPLGTVSGQAGDNQAGPASEGAEGDADERAVPDSPAAWAALLSVLYERRALAFGTGRAPLLDQVFSPDSPQLAADVAELTRLTEAGQVLRGFAPRVLEILDVRVQGDRATVQLTDEFGDYETVPALDTRAEALAIHPGRGPATVDMTLVLSEDGWRIHTAQRLG
ncbi:MAG: serine/threonine protein kinase [Actinomycetota bacterium]|nr:serine/threonine protein kinase [Actinomycetota bacterium]